MFKIWTQWIDLVDKVIIHFTAVLMGLMAIFISYQVFSRYVLRFSPYWTEEIATTAMMWVGLLAASCAIWTDSHMELDMLARRFPAALQLWLRVFSDGLIVAFACFMLWDGIRLVQLTMSGIMATVPIEIGYTFLVVPISGGLTILFGLTKAIDRIRKFYPRHESNSNEGVAAHG